MPANASKQAARFPDDFRGSAGSLYILQSTDERLARDCCRSQAQRCFGYIDDSAPVLGKDHARKQCRQSRTIRSDSSFLHELICSPGLIVATTFRSGAKQAGVVQDRGLHAKSALPGLHQIVGLVMSTIASKKLQHCHQSEGRGLHSTLQHCLKQLLAQLKSVCLATPIQQLRVDQVIRLQVQGLHILYQKHGTVKVSHPDAAFDEDSEH
mmetsp:Transcript_39533/g.59764  ORF Transcript_39533/g.59764 Transcript_39533/m.59764 type:complete len:210 (-) Transcript_39533:390-1019(-)